MLEEISGCCASVIPRLLLAFGPQPIQIQISPLLEWSSLSTTLVRITFTPLLINYLPLDSNFLSPLQLTVQRQKRKDYSKLFHIIPKFFSLKFRPKNHSSQYLNMLLLTFHQFLHLSRKEKKNLRIRNKKKKKKRGRRKRTGTLFAYEARFLWRIIVAQAGTYRHDDKEDRFPSAARKNYTRGNTWLVRITGRFPQTQPIASRSTFVNHASEVQKMLSFVFASSFSLLFLIFIYFLIIDERNLFVEILQINGMK